MRTDHQSRHWRRPYYLAIAGLILLAIILLVTMVITLRAKPATAASFYQVPIGLAITDINGRPIKGVVRIELYRVNTRYLPVGQHPVMVGQPGPNGRLQTRLSMPVDACQKTLLERLLASL